ncbi:MAG: GNAT family N-acetyltransferase, partial [Anaerolineaceae bacterium]|nr:GNAT family N-acetyltransferase [Anaerolineaceae bacterium]
RIITDQSKNPTIASLAYQKWMKDLLKIEGWREKHQVTQFKWDYKRKMDILKSIKYSSAIRRMTRADIREVTSIDKTCFQALWQQSQEALEHAYDQSAYSTVFEIDQSICGFQISTMDKGKAHLARLAVLPDFQNRHIGEQLVLNMLKHVDAQGIKDISVNTQKDNYISINLYKKLQFNKTDDSFPVYLYR